MRRCFSALLARWGQTVCRELPGQEAQRWKAFVQPVPGRQGEDERAFTPLGSVDERRWVYIGTMEVARYDTLEGCGGAFLVKEATPVYLGDEILYWHAMLWRAKEVAP